MSSSLSSHIKYANYIVRHKWFVFQAGRRTGASLWRLLKHDWSKMLPSEWMPYVEYFYGSYQRYCGPDARPNEDANVADYTVRVSNAFNKAWLLHQRRNDHHWQFWLLNNDDGTVECLPMPEKVWREMVADWMGAGRAVTGRWECSEWYEKNKEKIQLHPDTRKSVETVIAKTEGYYVQ